MKIVVLQNLLTSAAFDGITSATITVDTKAKTVNITASDTVFTKAAGVTIPMTQNTYPNNASIQEIVEVIDRALSTILSKK